MIEDLQCAPSQREERLGVPIVANQQLLATIGMNVPSPDGTSKRLMIKLIAHLKNSDRKRFDFLQRR